jgi:hypothetical protein
VIGVSNESRAKIEQAAQDLLEARGFSVGIPVTEVARAAGVSARAVSREIGAGPEVWSAVLQAAGDRGPAPWIVAFSDRIAALPAGTDRWAVLEAVLIDWIGAAGEDGEKGALPPGSASFLAGLRGESTGPTAAAARLHELLSDDSPGVERLTSLVRGVAAAVVCERPEDREKVIQDALVASCRVDPIDANEEQPTTWRKGDPDPRPAIFLRHDASGLVRILLTGDALPEHEAVFGTAAVPERFDDVALALRITAGEPLSPLVGSGRVKRLVDAGRLDGLLDGLEERLMAAGALDVSTLLAIHRRTSPGRQSVEGGAAELVDRLDECPSWGDCLALLIDVGEERLVGLPDLLDKRVEFGNFTGLGTRTKRSAWVDPDLAAVVEAAIAEGNLIDGARRAGLLAAVLDSLGGLADTYPPTAGAIIAAVGLMLASGAPVVIDARSAANAMQVGAALLRSGVLPPAHRSAVAAGTRSLAERIVAGTGVDHDLQVAATELLAAPMTTASSPDIRSSADAGAADPADLSDPDDPSDPDDLSDPDGTEVEGVDPLEPDDTGASEDSPEQ